MITCNPFFRVFGLGIGRDELLGTSFTVDLDDRQYLVTARHVIDNLTFDKEGRGEVRLKFANGWKRLEATLVGKGGLDLDVAVLALTKVITDPCYTMEPNSVGVAMGQDCYFLGFPFGISFHVPTLQQNPHAFIKKATVSMIEQVPSGMPCRVFLDGINNPGFSGGPIVFSPHNVPSGQPDYKVLGVISGYRCAPALLHAGDAAVPGDLHIRENTGIVVGYHVGHVRDFIKANPIGAKLR